MTLACSKRKTSAENLYRAFGTVSVLRILQVQKDLGVTNASIQIV